MAAVTMLRNFGREKILDPDSLIAEVAENREEFVARVRALASDPAGPEREEQRDTRRELVRDCTWDRKARELLDLVFGVRAPDPVETPTSVGPRAEHST